VRAAELLAPEAGRPADLRDFLPRVLIDLMRDIGLPNGLAAVGYGDGDVPDLVEGTLKQQRLLATAPRAVTEDDVAAILRDSLELW
jgi:alcohol dehydrogenase class IV